MTPSSIRVNLTLFSILQYCVIKDSQFWWFVYNSLIKLIPVKSYFLYTFGWIKHKLMTFWSYNTHSEEEFSFNFSSCILHQFIMIVKVWMLMLMPSIILVSSRIILHDDFCYFQGQLWENISEEAISSMYSASAWKISTGKFACYIPK